MNAAWTIYRRELAAYFFSPIAYVVLCGFLLYQGIHFTLIVAAFQSSAFVQMTPVQAFFGGTIFYYLLLLVVCPLLTMRLFAEERRSGTYEMLMTAPVAEAEVVAGKYLAAVTFYASLWLPTLTYVWIVAKQMSLDPGPVAASYAGTILVGMVFLAVGTLLSAASRNQIVAAMLTFAILGGLAFTLGILQLVWYEEGLLREALGYINLWSHMEDFAKGIVDTRHLAYYATVIAFALYATVRTLETSRGT